MVFFVSSHLHPLPAVRTVLSLRFFSFSFMHCGLYYKQYHPCVFATFSCSIRGLGLHATICDSLLTIGREGARAEGKLG